MAREIETGFGAGVYTPTAGELASVEHGLRDVADGKFATDAQVEAVFAKLSKRAATICRGIENITFRSVTLTLLREAGI